MTIKDKSLRKMLTPYLNNGWSIEDGSKHFKFKHTASGRMITISKTASCPFFLKHVEGDIRRTLREISSMKSHT